MVLGKLNAQLIKISTGIVLLTADFEPWSATWNMSPHKQKPILSSPTQNRYTNNHMRIPKKENCSPQANNDYRIRKIGKLTTFYGGSDGWPVKQAWIEDINLGNYTSWSGLIAALVCKHYKQHKFTVMVHMHAWHSDICSTQIDPLPTHDLLQEGNGSIRAARPGVLISKTCQVNVHIIIFADLKDYISTDFSGRFPDMSSRGINYTFIFYDYDSNTTLAARNKSQKVLRMIAAYFFAMLAAR